MDYSVVVFAQDEMRWTGNARYFAHDRPDHTGAYTVNTLAPGDYYAVALDYVDPAAAADPQLLEGLREKAVRVSLAEGDSKTLTLTLVEPGR
jgi:hypothetical protein